jgi:TolB-like protein
VFGAKVAGGSAEGQPSIAVLPFADMSPGKDNEWFSDGLAEEIINALTHISGLKVIARTSAFAFKGKQEDIRRIAEMLGVANILEGSVRKAGDRIRVTAQLITAADGSHLWSERYDRDMTDVFAMQDEIAAAIAGALQMKLATEPASQRRYEPNPAAYEAYLKARYLFEKLDPEPLAQSREYLEQAIALDPEFALAHCALADHFLLLASVGFMPAHEAMPLLREEARKALDIDHSLPEAHALLGVVAGCYDYEWREAERCFRLAMSRDPVPPQVLQWYGFFYLLSTGRAVEALEQNEQGLKADPLNIAARLNLSGSLFAVGKLAEAKIEAHKILELEESQAQACYALASYYASEEKWTEALHFAEKGFPRIDQLIGIHAGVLKRMGKARQSEELIQKLMLSGAHGAQFGLCTFYLICGEVDKAADWMRKVIEQRNPNAAVFASVFFRFSSQQSSLAKLMNLPEEVG